MERKHILIISILLLLSVLIIFQDLLFQVPENECYLAQSPRGLSLPVGKGCNLYEKDNSSKIQKEIPPGIEWRGAQQVSPADHEPKDEPIIAIPNNNSNIESIENQFITINGQKFLLYHVFLVSELIEEDFIGLYDLLKTNSLILYIFDSSTETRQYFNDHVPTGTDIIWIDNENTIINIASVPYCEGADKMSYQERLEKCTIISSEGKYLLETHNGFIDEHNIEIGSKTEIHLPNP